MHRILVVDDEERIRQSLGGLLREYDYEVVTASSGLECLQIMSSQPFDLVILDIVMPGMDGIEVLQRIKEEYKDTEVIIITGYADKEKSIATFRLGVYDFIEKPFESREILNTIANCLNQLKLRKEVERKTADLIMAEEKYRDLYDHAPDMYHSIDKDGYIVEVNQTEADILGYFKDELIGRHLTDIFTEDSKKEFEKDFPALLKKGSLSGLERQVICKDGRVISVSINVSVVYDEKEEPVKTRSIMRDITVKKRMQKELAAEKERLHVTLCSIGDGVIATDREGKILLLNQVAEELTGWKQEEAVGKPYFEVFHIIDEKTRKVAECPIAGVIMTGLTVKISGHKILVARDGTERIISDSNAPIKDKEGNIIGAVLVFRDITEHRRAEEAMLESKEKFHTITNTAVDAILLMDNEGKISYWNRSAERMFGYTSEEALGKELHTLLAPASYYDLYKKGFHTFKETGLGPAVGTTSEFLALRKDGTEFPIEVSTSAIQIKEQWNAVGVIRDLTERKKNEDFIKNILESVDEGFIVIDREYRIISANRAFCAQVKMPVSDIIGKHCYEISHRKDIPCYELGEECSVRYTFETGEPCSSVHTHYDKDNTPLYISMKSYPMKNASGKIDSVIEIVHDITEKKKLEAQLLHAQKMEAIGQFAGGIAHDFNNILTAIIGYGNLLQIGLNQDETMSGYVDSIVDSAEKAASLTQALLAFSRKQLINTKPVNINEIIIAIEKLLPRLIGEDIEVSVHLSSEDLIVIADAPQIEQVLMNLATNARDAMSDGGSLIIRTDVLILDDDFINAHGFGSRGHYALISVMDTGHGMDNITKEKIFEPFFTTKEVGKGTGLGLSMAYGIVEQHGGYIDVYSELGKGTVFKIYLPLIKSNVEEVKPAAISMPKTGTEVILLAEDDKEVRNLTRNVLDSFGYQVIEAVNGEDAINKFIKDKDKIQFLIFDLIMPKKNGKEAFEAIKKIRPDMKVLFMSGYADDIIQKKGALEEGITLMQKPNSPYELLRKLRELLDN